MNVTLRVEFDKPLHQWDGFGVNYVETAQSRDYARDPQDYGGFSTLDESKRREIIDLIFGEQGLQPGIVKMFLDPWHQSEPGRDPRLIDNDREYDHQLSTKWQRYFVSEGLKTTRARGADFTVLTDLYGPPAFITKQKIMRGRDLDPSMKNELAKYVCAYAKYLREIEHIPVKFVGFHNEGECWPRWPEDGTDSPKHAGDDYNMAWTPEMVVDFIPLVRKVLDLNGMADIGVTPGETSNWPRFHFWGFADAIADSESALRALGLITSHGFAGGWGEHCRWFGDWRSAGNDIIRAKRPELHSWSTSTSWSKMDASFVWELFNSIYSAKVNGIIPWATIQNPALWTGGDPNPGNAIQVDGKGGYEVRAGYWYFKQICRAGQAGMHVARIRTNDSRVLPVGFSSAGSANPDAIVVINPSTESFDIDIELRGTPATAFESFRTSAFEHYAPIGTVPVRDGRISASAPAGSVTTLYAKR